MKSQLSSRPIHVAHCVFRLDTGGMENGLINLINRLPENRFAHTIVCLTYASDFRNRIERDDIEIVEFHKPDGKYPALYSKVYRELVRIRPDIVHTRNIGTLDFCWAAFAARCPVRIHGEHGWDAADARGLSRKYRLLRRCCDPAVHRYIPVSKDIRNWLHDVIGVADRKIECIHNGVDVKRFTPHGVTMDLPFPPGNRIIFGTVGRQDAIKGLDVFLQSIRIVIGKRPELKNVLGIILAGDGPEHERCKAMINEYGLQETVYLPGKVDNVPALLRTFDFFVQPSINEGISNTLLEAKSMNLPVVCTRVGGKPELVRHEHDGLMVEPGDADSLAASIEKYLDDPELRRQHGEAGRRLVERSFTLDAMADAYAALYTTMTARNVINTAA